MYLLDTNVLSETSRIKPDERVRRWLTTMPPVQMHTAALVYAELLFGAERHPDPIRAQRYRAYIENARATLLRGRILPFDEGCARTYARLLVLTQRRQRPVNDLQIAAVAITNELTLVTRNTDDFENLGLLLLNPWLT